MQDQPVEVHSSVKNLVNYINPNYANCEAVNPGEIAKTFNSFVNTLLIKGIPSTAENPKNAYDFNAHMGQFVRHMDAALNEYTKGLLAFYAEKKTTH